MVHLFPPMGAYALRGPAGIDVIFDSDAGKAHELHRFVKRVLTSKDAPFYHNKRGRRCATHIGEFWDRLPEFGALYSPHYEFAPYLKLFLEQYRAHPASSFAGASVRAAVCVNADVGDVFADLVEALRGASRSEGTRKAQADWDSKFNNQRRRLQKLDKACFERCTNVLIVPVHLHLSSWVLSAEQIQGHEVEKFRAHRAAATAYCSKESLTWGKSAAEGVTFEELQQHRQRFWANAKGRPSVFRDLLAYAWTMEHSPQAGYHLRSIFFFDGTKELDRADMARRIGEYWCQVTHGLGGWLGGDKLTPAKERELGIGLVHAGDTAQRNTARSRLLLHFGRKAWVVPSLPPGANAFGTSKLRRLPKQAGNQRRKSEKTISEIVIPQLNQRTADAPTFSPDWLVSTQTKGGSNA